jgi:hypothetical protein
LLAIAAVLFVGWMGWLGYTALTKSRAPTVSHAQAAAASVAVRAELSTGVADREVPHRWADPRGGGVTGVLKEQADKPSLIVKVVEPLSPNAPVAGTEIGVTNLTSCNGYNGPGEYLLLLNPENNATIDGKPAYILVGPQRSPGAEVQGAGPPQIYPWSADVGKQVKQLYP